MTEEKTTYDMQTILFTQLVLSFQASAMQQMGKVMNIFTHKVERDLAQAQMSIDMLAMLQDKTMGNLTEEEARLLDRALFELRMNYVDEVEKDRKKKEQESPERSEEEGDLKDGEEQDEGLKENAMSDAQAEGTQTSDVTEKETPARQQKKKRRQPPSARKSRSSAPGGES